MSQLNVLSSNRIEILYEALKLELFQKTWTPFPRRLVVVPSPAMKTWLLLRLANDPDCNIAAGLEICFIDRALECIRRSISDGQSDVLLSHDEFMPNEMELSFIFEALIAKKIITGYSRLNWEEREIWSPLLHHLKTSENNDSSAKVQLRLIALCSRLARLFLRYGQHGCQMLHSWENSAFASSWQEQLWKDIKKLHPQLCFSYQQLPQMLEDLKANTIAFKNMQLHVFGLSFIPGQVHQFLTEAACAFPLNYYMLSPCQAFWSDICSDKEKVKLQRYWEQKGISKPQQQALELFLRERNGLLANFGRMGREMALQIETSTHQIVECYQLHGAIKNNSCYAEDLPPDVILDDEEGSLSLLQAIQIDMTLLRNANQSEKLELSADDHSIQLHVAYTKYREVEILYNTLLHLLTKHANDQEPITPSDIIVMVPDLMSYESVICSIFGAKTSQLDFQIMEMQQLAKSSLLQGFLHLLSLASSRWEAESLLQLLEYPEFQSKQGFSFSDIQQIRTWIQLSGAQWGQNIHHRNTVLKNDHGNCELIDASPTGTWEHSISRLLMAIAIEPSGLNDDVHAFILPVDEMETSQIELLSKWLSLLNTLQKDIKVLSDGSKMELFQWASYLEVLKEKYFRTDSSNKEDSRYSALLTSHIKALASVANFVKNEYYSFDSVYFQLEKGLMSEASPYRETHLQGIRFCSLLPMRAVPAKVIVLIGMEEGAFPRKEIPFSLNELTSHRDADYFPSQTDFDRYLFLEALLSARHYFILSYVGYCFEGPRETAPSLLVQELLSYLDSGYRFGNQKPSEHCVHRHPFNSFDKIYFAENSLFPSYIHEHYLLAKAHYQKNKNEAHRFIVNFSSAGVSEESEVSDLAEHKNDSSIVCQPPISQTEIVKVTVKELAAFASNPLKAYFNKSLNIYLDVSSNNQIQNEESFSLTGLEKYQLKIDGIKMPVLNLMDKASKKGMLPRGLFKHFSSEGVIEEIDKMHLNFSQNNVDPLRIRPLIFSEHCETPTFDDNGGWTLPPLLLDHEGRYAHLKIVGTLKEVSSEGFIFHQKRDLVGVLKVWPQYLILCLAIKKYDLPIKPQLISSKDAKPFSFPQEKLVSQFEKFLEYYFLGMQTPSPMIPEWIPDFLKGDADHFSKSMLTSLEGSFSSLYNEYALWLFRDRQRLPTAEELYHHWQPLSESLYSELAQELR